MNRKGKTRISTILSTIFLLVVLIISFNIFKTSYFNGFEKAVAKKEAETRFSRDSKVKYTDARSYRVSNLEYNDSAIYKEIEVEPNTPYKITCMVKTENIQSDTQTSDAGVVIGLLDTTEYSKPITGTNDWQKVEYMFNSKNRNTVKISFRLGGNEGDCIGTAWFSDFKLEKGTKRTDTKWNVGCFIDRKSVV